MALVPRRLERHDPGSPRPPDGRRRRADSARSRSHCCSRKAGRRDALIPERYNAVVPRWVWLVYVGLFAASVPWYLPDGRVPIWLGLPYWVVLSLTAVFCIAIF